MDYCEWVLRAALALLRMPGLAKIHVSWTAQGPKHRQYQGLEQIEPLLRFPTFIDVPGDAQDVQRCVAVAQAPPAIDLDDHLRVAELVAERAMIGGATATSEAVHELFEILGFDVPPDRSVGELRRPDRTLLAVSLAAAERPSVVVIDNADAGCGAEEARRVWSALQMLAARGCTVLACSTQIPDIVDAAEIAATVLRHPLERVTIPAESEVYP